MIYGCIGEKLSHSFSKEIHNKLFDYDYEICEVKKEDLDEFMIKRDFKAINVTIPYKRDVMPHLYKISDVAQKIGAVNTIVNENGKLYGYNTDFYGMRALILKNGICLKNKKVLVLGSGGTSKTANEVALSLEAKEVLTVSRSAKNGQISYDEMIKKHSDAEIIINTTPVGMYPKTYESAVHISLFKKLEAVVDAVYNPLSSKLVLDAREKNIKAVGGLYMLVYQAAVAAEKFTGQKVSDEKIDSVFKEIYKGKQNIVLIGMPSCGKSTIGKILSKKLNKSFIDTDSEIEKAVNMPVSEFIRQNGEKSFREIESQMIFEVSKASNSVIATGGGAVLNPLNVKYLKQNGRIYFIDREFKALIPTSDRPLSSSIEDLKKRYDERYHIYTNSCDFHLKAGNDAENNAKIIKEEFLK